MEFIKLEIPEVILMKPNVHGDARGFFLETFRENEFAVLCAKTPFVQDNHAGSRQGVLRGLHYQIEHSQGKLIRAVRGEIFDVALDIRRSSPTFGKWVGATLSEQNRNQLWIPPHFAHGYFVVSEWAEVFYKTTDYYFPEFERTVYWNDPAIGIEWPFIEGHPVLISDKDNAGKLLVDTQCFE